MKVYTKLLHKLMDSKHTKNLYEFLHDFDLKQQKFC